MNGWRVMFGQVICVKTVVIKSLQLLHSQAVNLVATAVSFADQNSRRTLELLVEFQLDPGAPITGKIRKSDDVAQHGVVRIIPG